ncbi:MAG: hypothetical protein KC493_03460 [Bacteriovoracaceae bacterium]|nr:hypothetical protein [Bacteriovoracaceae bacterium]
MNKKTMTLLLILAAGGSSLGFSAEKKERCADLKKCIEKVSKLTGKVYLHGSKLKGRIKTSKNLVLTKENADRHLSRILYLNGYTRIPMSHEDGFMIISARDVRYSPTPQVIARKNQAPDLPDNFDYFQMVYYPKDADAILMKDFTRSVRPFLSRYGRVISMKYSGPMIVQDTAENLKRLYKMLKVYDRKLTKQEMDKRVVWQDRDFEIKKLEAENCASKKEVIREVVKSDIKR